MKSACLIDPKSVRNIQFSSKSRYDEGCSNVRAITSTIKLLPFFSSLKHSYAIRKSEWLCSWGHFGESLRGDTSLCFSSPLTNLCMFCSSLTESVPEDLGDPLFWPLPVLWLWCSDIGLLSLLTDFDDSDSALRALGTPVVSRPEL